MSTTFKDVTVPVTLEHGANHIMRQATVVHFSEPDDDNPFDWRLAKKWVTVLAAEFYSIATTIYCTAYMQGSRSMQRDFDCSSLAVTAGLTTFLVSGAFAPLILAPVSEQFGRRGTMLTSSVIFTLCYLPQALAPNITLMLVFRALQGAAASAGYSLVGGIIADVFVADTRGTPLTILAFMIVAGQSLGAAIYGWVEMTLGFRWIVWINMIFSAAITIVIYFLLAETRGSKILEDRAQRITLQTGMLHIVEADRNSKLQKSLLEQIKTSVSRPIVFLFTEPIVASFSTWTALLWGDIYILYACIPLVYSQYDFSMGEKGSVFVTIIVGVLFGMFAGRWQDHLYHRDAKKTLHRTAPPESRLYGACLGGLIVPISLFWFAWGGRVGVHWMVPTVALVFFNIGLFPIYLATFSYTADAYEQYASSAIAAQSFTRGIFGGVFPLFAEVMYKNLGYPRSSSILGGLALAFSIVPFLLMAYGPQIRKRSRVAKRIAWQQEERAVQTLMRLGEQH